MNIIEIEKIIIDTKEIEKELENQIEKKDNVQIWGKLGISKQGNGKIQKIEEGEEKEKKRRKIKKYEEEEDKKKEKKEEEKKQRKKR